MPVTKEDTSELKWCNILLQIFSCFFKSFQYWEKKRSVKHYGFDSSQDRLVQLFTTVVESLEFIQTLYNHKLVCYEVRKQQIRVCPHLWLGNHKFQAKERLFASQMRGVLEWTEKFLLCCMEILQELRSASVGEPRCPVAGTHFAHLESTEIHPWLWEYCLLTTTHFILALLNSVIEKLQALQAEPASDLPAAKWK